jgi:hypothetical protein
LDGRLEILLIDLTAHPPFDRSAARIELQQRLNGIVGFELADPTVETAIWQSIDAACLLSPGAFRQFKDGYEWVAERLVTGTMGEDQRG